MVSKKLESLDTNILLRVMLQDVPDQFEAVIRLMERENVMYRISDAVLSEVVFVLTRMGVDRESIVAILTKFIARPNIKVSELMDIELFWMYIHSPKLSFTDCYLALEATMNEAEPLWTFDRALAKQSPTAKML